MSSSWQKFEFEPISDKAINELSYAEFIDSNMNNNIREFAKYHPELFRILAKLSFNMNESIKLAGRETANYENFLELGTKLFYLLGTDNLDNK
jgi:hypothetical protein